MDNLYKPFLSKILKVNPHTDIEYTFRMEYAGEVKPGQFFEVSIPKYGEAPISISGIGDGWVELTIRRVGKVTSELFESSEGKSFFMRGPYGNGFDLDLYKGKQLVVVAGGTGVSPVRGVINHFSRNLGQVDGFSVIVGFRSPEDILFSDDIALWKENKGFTLTVDHASEGYTGSQGMVTKYIPDIQFKDINTAQIVIVGPPRMMTACAGAFIERGVPEENIWISHERRMSCGLGKCGHCRMSHKYVCLDGPVFNYADAKHLVD
ncbi:MAG: anaerobic sulfite reductase subunit AsrB [Oscillospiraceae bacterium]|nr:anaerobic sulfite reductase subunit AsrB [Oscillospiraceae bacterium]